MKKTLKFPTAFAVLFFITIFAVILTWVIPAGKYERLDYDVKNKVLQVHMVDNSVSNMPANQETLDKLNIAIPINKFVDGIIKKPIAIPGTYHRVEQNPKSIMDVTGSMVLGTIEGIDVIVFIFVLGGLIGVVNLTGAFSTGLKAMANKTKGKEFLVVFSVSLLMCLGGTACGMEEEAVAFYPILCPIFLILGYDAIVCVGAIFLAASIGTGFSLINPFAVVIASNAAGISFLEGIQWRIIGLIGGFLAVVLYLYWYANKIKKDPSSSYNYENDESFRQRWLEGFDMNKQDVFTARKKIILTLFSVSFLIMIFGVMELGWWFPQMASMFLVVAIIIIFISGIPEKDMCNAFIKGAAELIGVALIIGLARGVNLVMEEGLIADTILNYLSHSVEGMNPTLFIIGQLFIFFILGFIVPSSSGLAVLAVPIMAPLADTVGLPRHVVVSAYNWGQYAMLFLTPTGLVLATLQMLDIPYGKWLKFIIPIVIFMLVWSVILLVTQVNVYM